MNNKKESEHIIDNLNVELIFERANLQQLRAFLLTGNEVSCPKDELYMERLNIAYEKFKTSVFKHIPNASEESTLLTDLKPLLNEYMNVFMEIGMQAGLRLSKEFLTIEGNKVK